MTPAQRDALRQKIHDLPGLAPDEKSALLHLLHTRKRYGLVWEEKEPEDVEKSLLTQLPVLREVVEKRILADGLPNPSLPNPSLPNPGLPNPSEGGAFPDTSAAAVTLPMSAAVTLPMSAAVTLPFGEGRGGADSRGGAEHAAAQIPFGNDKKETSVLPSPNPSAPNHLLIEGDNLHALTALSFTHAGRVDVIYIDPPYNTGNKDFKYNDSFVDREDSYRHSKWIGFMHKRLVLARQLLKDTGVIFISIDDNEQAQLKLLCDEVFGEGNFVANVIWQKKYAAANDHKTIAPMHDYLKVYSKSEHWKRRLLPRTEKNDAQYRLEDEQGIFRADNYTCNKTAEERPNLFYPVRNPNTGEEIWPKRTAVWRYSLETHLGNVEKGLVYWGKDGKGRTPAYKRYRHALKGGGLTVPNTWWDYEFASHTDAAKKELLSIFHNEEAKKDFVTPKPTLLIQRVLQIAADKSALILDFFAGSGTTLHATMALNAEDGGSRQCILVTNNENRICEEVTYERNRRVIAGYTNARGAAVAGLRHNNLRYYQTAFVPAERTEANRRALTAAATELLCIREDCYEDLTEAEGFRPAQCRLFRGAGGRLLVVVYHSRQYVATCEALCAWIAAQPAALASSGAGGSPSPAGRAGVGLIRLYAFSPNLDSLLEDFAPVAERIQAIPLPEAVLNAYRATFRTLKLDKKETRETPLNQQPQ